MRKPISLLVCVLCLAQNGKAQLLTALTGSDITIIAGTPFVVENVTLVPSANFVLSNNTLTKSSVVTFPNGNPYILRVYKFTGSTPPYSGSLQINYTDGAELNGIPENALTLNNHTGSQWAAHLPFTRDNTNNFVLTSSLSNLVLNEFTLASVLSPLPLDKLTFTAAKAGQSIQLSWEQPEPASVLHYQLQHSRDGHMWTQLVTHNGGTGTASTFRHLHQTPEHGQHYYRLQIQSADNRTYYSVIRRVLLEPDSRSFTIAGNPVTKGWMQVMVHRDAEISFFSASGQLIWRKQFTAGQFILDLQSLAKGNYWLSTNAQTQAIIIQ
jgi:hypothetical protein